MIALFIIDNQEVVYVIINACGSIALFHLRKCYIKKLFSPPPTIVEKSLRWVET